MNTMEHFATVRNDETMKFAVICYVTEGYHLKLSKSEEGK